jgi:hypothetical protein
MTPTPGLAEVAFYVTAALLVAGVVALEVYRLRAGKRGRLRRWLGAGDGFGLGESRAEVEFADGRVVEARVSACTACACRFRPGDAVIVTKTAGGYVIGPAVR